MKKLFCIFLSVLLLLSMSVFAFAEGEEAATEEIVDVEAAEEAPADAVEDIEEIADIADVTDAAATEEPADTAAEEAEGSEAPAEDQPAEQPAPQTTKKLTGARLSAFVGLCLIAFGGLIWLVGQLKVKKHRKKKDN